jgi:TPR repeat protein
MEIDKSPLTSDFLEPSAPVITADKHSFTELSNLEKLHNDDRIIQDMMEQRKKNQLQNHQWYFDEYSGLYRHIIPSKERVPTKTFSPAISTISLSIVNDDLQWPIPSGIEQVHQLCKFARSTKDPQKQLSLCKTLMDTQHDITRKKNKELDQVIIIEAQKLLKELASNVRANTAEAQVLLASCYGAGSLGLPLDREKAFLLYIQASKHSHPESNYRAGVCYELGIGTKKDYNRAVSFYRRASTLSHVGAMYKLSIILLRGYCQQIKNTREGIALLQRAIPLATKSFPHPLHALAILLISDEFSEQLIADTDYALELLHEAARLDYVPSQVKLGELYETGKLVEVNDAQSIYWYTKSAERGSAEAALALSSWYLTGSPNVLDQSDREAYLWARKAIMCQHTDRWTMAKAYFLIGIYVEMEIGIIEEEDAMLWFQRSAALGHRGALEKVKRSTAFLKASKSYVNINNK